MNFRPSFQNHMASPQSNVTLASPPSLLTSVLENSTAIPQLDVTLGAPPISSSLPPPSPPASPPLSPPASPPPTPPATSSPPSSPPPVSPPPPASISPPPSSTPPTPPQSSPPPPNESPQSPPPSPPTEPLNPSSPPPSSPPPQSQSSPPPTNPESPPTSLPPPASTSTPVSPLPPSEATTPPLPPNSSLPAPVFSPPPPNSLPNQPTPHLPGTGTPSYPTPSSSHASPAKNSPPTRASDVSTPSSNSSPDTGIIVGAAVGVGVVAVLIAVICVLLFKRKKRQPYYMDHGHPPKPGEPYYNASNWNSPMEHIIKISPPPGLMATPVGGGTGAGVWGTPPPPPPAANSSSEYTSNSCQQQQQQYFGPISPGGGGVMGGGGLGGFSKFQFSYEELAAATGGFSQANLLGQGGFGYVHKGVLPDGKEVAIKSLKDGSGQGEREFQAEVEIISRVHHRHLVSLVGYCIVENQRMLVYEFVPNKTLEFHLHGKGQPVMDWGTRLKIALGSAKGLAYLHEDCHPRIIHRDIKAANILLDDKNEAMVADFGLAKLTSDNSTHVSTRVMGTFGYLAPEYASSGKLTEKSDVFSFGVMLLELITGKRPVDSTNMYVEDSLVDWARSRLAKALEDGNYDELADSRLDGNYVRQEMSQMISCAAACIRHSARRRPKMSQIVRALDGDSSVDLNDGPKRTNSGTYNIIPETQTYNTDMYNADMIKFKKMVMSSGQDSSTSEHEATSEYGMDPTSSSSEEFRYSHQRNKKI